MNYFDQKDPSEKVVLTFDFTPGLDTGETLNGTPTVTVTCVVGVDANPANLLNGSPTFDPSSKKVYQAIEGGLSDRNYVIRAVSNTTNVDKVLALSAILPVR